MKTYKINMENLEQYLDKWRENEDWDEGNLSLLEENCKKNLAWVLSEKEECILTVDDEHGSVTIDNIDNIEEKFKVLPLWAKEEPKKWVYRHIKSAMKEAENDWVFEEIFEEC